jgi:hypothetical protein
MSQHLRQFAFKPGQSGNPAGRPKGSRNKLAEALLDDLYAEWQEQGRDAIKRMAEKNPGDFVKVVASTMPKLVGFDSDPLTGLSDTELREYLEFIDIEIAKSKEPTATIGLIEQQGSAEG